MPICPAQDFYPHSPSFLTLYSVSSRGDYLRFRLRLRLRFKISIDNSSCWDKSGQVGCFEFWFLGTYPARPQTPIGGLVGFFFGDKGVESENRASRIEINWEFGTPVENRESRSSGHRASGIGYRTENKERLSTENATLPNLRSPDPGFEHPCPTPPRRSRDPNHTGRGPCEEGAGAGCAGGRPCHFEAGD